MGLKRGWPGPVERGQWTRRVGASRYLGVAVNHSREWKEAGGGGSGDPGLIGGYSVPPHPCPICTPTGKACHSWLPSIHTTLPPGSVLDLPAGITL